MTSLVNCDCNTLSFLEDSCDSSTDEESTDSKILYCLNLLSNTFCVRTATSFIFAAMTSDCGIVFHKTHSMSKMADVIGCRVHIGKDENVQVKLVDGSKLAFALYKDNQPVEVFAVSDEEQLDQWMNHIGLYVFQ